MIDGHSLSVPQVIAITQSATRVDMNPNVRDRVSASITGLDDHLAAGNVVYGVNTGFGCAVYICRYRTVTDKSAVAAQILVPTTTPRCSTLFFKCNSAAS